MNKKKEKGKSQSDIPEDAGPFTCVPATPGLGRTEPALLPRGQGYTGHCGCLRFKSTRPDSDTALNASPIDSF